MSMSQQAAPPPAQGIDVQGNPFMMHKQGTAQAAARLNAFKFKPYTSPGDRVLEFGCSGGWLLKELTAAERVGIEPDRKAQEVCRWNGIEVVDSAAQLGSRKFNRVISNHYLEHLPHPTEELRGLRAVMDKDALLVLVVPIDDWRTQKDWERDDVDQHLQTWTPPSLANTLELAGFKVDSVAILTHAWPPFWDTLSRRLPAPILHLVCTAWGHLRRRRQLVALARNPG